MGSVVSKHDTRAVVVAATAVTLAFAVGRWSAGAVARTDNAAAGSESADETKGSDEAKGSDEGEDGAGGGVEGESVFQATSRGKVSTYVALNPWWITPVAEWVRTGVAPPMDPPLPPLLRPPAMTRLRLQPVPEFGLEMRKAWFTVDQRTAFLNHGSYGGTLKHAMDSKRFFTNVLESNPVAFMEDVAIPQLVDAIRDLAEFVGSQPEDIVFVPNATTGVNAVVRSFPLKRGDVVLSFTASYDACMSAIDYAAKRVGARLVKVQVDFPVVMDTVLATVKQALKDHPTAVLAVFDHVTSTPAVIMPIKEIVDTCHEAGVKVFVDGAHSVGQLPLNLRELDADYYTSNLHKWVCCPKGTAFLWVHKRNQADVHPTITSHGYGLGFVPEFFWPATYDLTSYLAVPTALAVYRRVGAAKIREHNHNLAVWAGNMLAKRWGTDVLTPADQIGCMVSVRLPHGTYETEQSVSLARLLRHKYYVELPVFRMRGEMYVRVSAQMYNYEAEYERLADAVLEVQGIKRDHDA